MAEGSKTKFPPEIVMNDDDPKKGYVTLFLTIPGLKVKKHLLAATEVKNGSVQVKFNEDSLSLEVKVDVNSKTTEYSYTKRMPENVIPAKCSHKVKNEQVVLHIAKVTADSWAAHQRYMMRRELQEETTS